MLAARIKNMQNLTAVMFGNLKTMNRSELTQHMVGVRALGCQLPYSVRLAYLRRQADDLMTDLKDCAKKTAAVKLAGEITSCLSLWSGPDPRAENLNAWQIWDAEASAIRAKVDRGDIADAEMEEQINTSAEATCTSATCEACLKAQAQCAFWRRSFSSFGLARVLCSGYVFRVLSLVVWIGIGIRCTCFVHAMPQFCSHAFRACRAMGFRVWGGSQVPFRPISTSGHGVCVVEVAHIDRSTVQGL